MSASSGRYQSRLFNFIARQSRQWGDRVGQAARHLKVTLTWGAQLLIYPIYAIFETARSVGRQMGGASPAQETAQLESPEPTPADSVADPAPPTRSPLPPADAPIQHVLEIAELSARPDLEASPNAPIARLKATLQSLRGKSTTRIRGIASLCQTRGLVLVDEDNGILDVLDAVQQDLLQQYILDEVAAYWQQWRAAGGSPALPPIRWLRRAIAWVQSTPAAKALPQFPEPTVAAALPRWNWQRFVPQRAIAMADRAIARLETGTGLRVQSRHLANRASEETGMSAEADPGRQAPSLRMQALIRAAIDYFFGRPPASVMGDTDDLGGDRAVAGNWDGASLPAAKPSEDELDDPWLTMDDLFAAKATREPKAESESADAVPSLTGKSPAHRQRLPQGTSAIFLHQSKDFVKGCLNSVEAVLPARPGNSAIAPQSKGEVAPTAPAGVPSPASAPRCDLQSHRDRPSEVKSQPPASDWVDAEATAVGYVKHPLERLLDWFDRLALWIEGAIVKLWQWIRAQVSGRSL